MPTFELPGVYLDAIVLDATAARPRIQNRQPQPNEVTVPLDSTVAVDLVDPAGVGISILDTIIYINGVPAFLGGAFPFPFNGPLSAVTTPYTNCWRVTIDPTTDFASDATVDVYVETKTTDLVSASVSYHFHTADETAPRLIDATAYGRRVVRLQYDEAVLMLSESGVHDALNPANYSIVPLTAPSIPLAVVSVAPVTTLLVDLTLDADMPEGVLYEVTVDNVEDAAENPVAPPYNTANFVGFALVRPAGREWDLWRMLPEKNRREDSTEDLHNFIRCLQEVNDQLLADVDAWTDILDGDIAPEAFVDALLADLGNPFTVFDLSTTEKRKLLRVLVSLYRKKGTVPGIVDAIRFFLGIEVEIFSIWAQETLSLGESELDEEWYLGSGETADYYTFEVHTPDILTDEQRRLMRWIVDYMKVAHEHYEIIEPGTPPPPLDPVELGLSELGEDWYLH
jgi:phage tail-like protein